MSCSRLEQGRRVCILVAACFGPRTQRELNLCASSQSGLRCQAETLTSVRSCVGGCEFGVVLGGPAVEPFTKICAGLLRGGFSENFVCFLRVVWCVCVFAYHFYGGPCAGMHFCNGAMHSQKWSQGCLNSQFLLMFIFLYPTRFDIESLTFL